MAGTIVIEYQDRVCAGIARDVGFIIPLCQNCKGTGYILIYCAGPGIPRFCNISCIPDGVCYLLTNVRIVKIESIITLVQGVAAQGAWIAAITSLDATSHSGEFIVHDGTADASVKIHSYQAPLHRSIRYIGDRVAYIIVIHTSITAIQQINPEMIYIPDTGQRPHIGPLVISHEHRGVS